MTSHAKTYLRIGIIIASMLPCHAWAIEKLHYTANDIPAYLLPKIQQQINEAQSQLLTAKADLNSDGIEEFIIKSHNCAQHKSCPHHIFAINSTELIELSTIEALDIALGEESNAGIRNLLVFKNALNDFDYEVYTWHSKDKKYKPKL